MTDGLGNSTHYEYTLTGRFKKVTDALGNETEYGYDVCDRLIEIRQYGEFGNTEENKSDKAVSGLEPAPSIDHELLEAQEHNRESRSCQITRYERDLSGQVTKIVDALGREEQYTYGKRGELLSKLDRDGYLTAYGYTEKGDINRIQYADGREVRLSYNPLRQLEELEDWLGITRIENDALGRAVKVSYPEGETVTYTYGKAGERTGLTYPDGRTVTYGYDELLRLTELRDGEQSIRYAYDSQGRLESLIHSDREGILDAYAYRYDILGNKTAIEKQRRGLKEESGSYTYGYDALGRVSSVTKDGILLRSYVYDAFGNRTGLKEGERETRYIYNALNQLISLTDGEMTERYGYDKRGNLTELLRNGNIANQYLYGALNRLEKAVNAEGIQASYQYNGLGYRTGKRIKESLPDPEKQIRYTIDLTRQYHNLLAKEEEGESISFLWDGSMAGMRRTGGSEAGGQHPGKPEYYLQDDLGSPLRLLNEAGDLTESYGYDEFGRDLYGNQGEVQPFGYTGYQYDQISNTYFAQAREYISCIGRFAGQDIIKGSTNAPYTLNRYGYCWGAPLIFRDLDGLAPTEDECTSGYFEEVMYSNIEGPSILWNILGYKEGWSIDKSEDIIEKNTLRDLDLGIKLLNAEVGIGKIGFYNITGFLEEKLMLKCVTAEAKAEMSTQYIGAGAKASLVTLEGSVKVIEVFDIQIQISSNFDLFSVGSKYGYSLKENKLEVGASLLIGGDIEISAEKIERGWM